MYLDPVKLAEVINKQAAHEEQIGGFASLFDFVQAGNRRQHQDVIVEAMIGHKQFKHHQHGENGTGARGQGFRSPTYKSEQSADCQARGIRQVVTYVRIVNETGEKGLQI
jgi:hypothetical protein